MTFEEYDKEAEKTAVYPRENNIGLCYVFLGLVEEAGECSGKIKKIIQLKMALRRITLKNSLLYAITTLFYFLSLLFP